MRGEEKQIPPAYSGMIQKLLVTFRSKEVAIKYWSWSHLCHGSIKRNVFLGSRDRAKEKGRELLVSELVTKISWSKTKKIFLEIAKLAPFLCLEAYKNPWWAIIFDEIDALFLNTQTKIPGSEASCFELFDATRPTDYFECKTGNSFPRRECPRYYLLDGRDEAHVFMCVITRYGQGLRK